MKINSLDNSEEKFNENHPTDHNNRTSNFYSLRDLLNAATGRDLADLSNAGDSGISDKRPFPFLALVKQNEMKLGLLLALINPALGGVLLMGPRGTGKTTAVRGLIDLLPSVLTSTCYYGCLEEDVENGGMDAVCPNCAEKFGLGNPLSSIRSVKMVDLPLNADLDDVIGRIDKNSNLHQRMQIKKGILSDADKNILFIDEVNLLSNRVVDVILDAAALGSYSVRRGDLSANYKSKFTLVGTMNPEEGKLRPQIMDRFGLRLIVTGLEKTEDRLEAYKRSEVYYKNPRTFVDSWENETSFAKEEIENARKLLPEVKLPDDVIQIGLNLIKHFEIASIRAEMTLFEAAKALAAAGNKKIVTKEDILQIAPMALRLRRSKFIKQYISERSTEEDELISEINKHK